MRLLKEHSLFNLTLPDSLADSLPPAEYFQSQLLSFSPNLDYHNPDIPEWRQDIGNVIKKALIKVSSLYLCLSLCG